MGNYCILLLIFAELYFSDNERESYKKIKQKLLNYKNLDLNTVFFCSKINLTNLVIHKQYSSILDLVIEYDKTQITLDIINESIYNDNRILNTKLLNQYKKNISNNHYFEKILKTLLKKCIIFNCENNFKLICNQLYKLKKKENEICCILDKYRNTFIYYPNIKQLIRFPSLSLPFNIRYIYPKHIQDCLNIIYSLNLPEELIYIICDFYIFNI